jgi:hypothetical protein
VRCSRCGNDNPETNRFCGSCGASLLAVTTPPSTARSESAIQSSPVRPPAPPMPAAPRVAAPVSEEVPAISGPSFLGLNAPVSRSSDRGSSLGRDSHSSRISRNLDYLLEDEEESKSGAGKFFLILIALALAVGFGYLRWRHEGLSSLMSGGQKPSAAAQTPDSAQPASNPGTQPNAPDSSSAPSQPAAGAQATATQPAAAPGADSSSANPPNTSAPGTTAGSPAAGNPAPTPNVAPSSALGDAAPADKPAPRPAAKDESPADADSTEPDPNDTIEKPAEPAAAPKRAARSPAAPKPSAAKSFDQVTEAEKYVYGRGERQDCDRGLRMLRPAAEQSNPRAMISLGALYSTGVCTPRDLPTAYRWFALALRKQPDNQPLQENLQRLWAQMTQPERQLAIKLSQ